MIKKSYYWDAASEEIGKQLKKYFNSSMNICEVGCGGGHFLRYLNGEGFKNLTGIEVRENQCNQTKKAFEQSSINIKLINADVLTVSEKYDAIYSTGLLQCLATKKRMKIIEHLSKMSPLAIFVVPEISKTRNAGADEAVAVAGCTEYSTGNFEWELSHFYKFVRSGTMDKDKICLEDNFLYYVCSMCESLS